MALALSPATQPIEPCPLPTAAERRPAVPLAHPSNRVMWLNDDRVFYAGLAGAMSSRTMGGWHLYVALGDPIRVAVDGRDWQTTDLAVVPPYVPHRVACDERLIADLVIEPETLPRGGLPAALGGCVGAVPHLPDLVDRVRQLHTWLCAHGASQGLQTADLDRRVFGHPLPRRRLDPRIEQALEAMRRDPAGALTAQQCAEQAGLSFSRFLHLFKQEAGASFRNLRAWKRARSLLHHVTRDSNLLHVALDTGYPDATHFSHSIRQVYGLRPRDLFAGSRRLTVLG
ncbi:AraC family transcriptional regulator [Ideonella sp. A 288]|uniref:helix-turn-helix transcriptional regulator n=1 Tax=Ideonella sp. A 288 TaxID=1962181 RepID=UPI001F32496F|nr:AraC family transcriptional regulator [Ideonella sp. A 288]